jgi:hypothetical protein
LNVLTGRRSASAGSGRCAPQKEVGVEDLPVLGVGDRDCGRDGDLGPGCLGVTGTRQRTGQGFVNEREVEVLEPELLGLPHGQAGVVKGRLGSARERVGPAAQVVSAYSVGRRAPSRGPVVLRCMGHVDHRLRLVGRALGLRQQSKGGVVAVLRERLVGLETYIMRTHERRAFHVKCAL